MPSLEGLKVHIGIPFYGPCPRADAFSSVLLQTCMALGSEGVLFNYGPRAGNCYVEQVRSYIADDFLRLSGTHLFMIDADMTWRPEDFVRVLRLATERDCVAGAYRVKNEREAYFAKFQPGVVPDADGCIPGTGLGLGFCCVQRRVIEAMAARAERLRANDRPGGYARVFRCDVFDGQYRGEDINFFEDLIAAGFQSWIDVNCVLDHWGVTNFSGSFKGIVEHAAGASGLQDVKPGHTAMWAKDPVSLAAAEAA